MLEHSLCKEASELLCDAVKCKINYGDVLSDKWIGSMGIAIPSNRMCDNSDGEEHHHDDDEPHQQNPGRGDLEE